MIENEIFVNIFKKGEKERDEGEGERNNKK